MSGKESILKEEVDKKQDHVYFETKGMAAGFDNDWVINAELMPGEQVVREFNVNTKLVNARPYITILFKSIMTLGVYYLWLLFCGCCRTKTMGNERRRVAVTSQGRVLVWKHDSNGTREPRACLGVCSGKQYFTAETEFTWFHLHDINTVQTLYFRNRPPMCCCTSKFGSDHQTYFRIAVGDEYPRPDLLRSQWDFAAHTIETEQEVDWAPAANFAGGAPGKRGFLTSGFSEARGSLIMEVFSGTTSSSDIPRDSCAAFCYYLTCGSIRLEPKWIDSAHESDESAFADAGRFIKFLVDNRVAPAWCGDEVAVQGKNFELHPEHEAAKNLIRGKVVQVYPRLLGLMPGESVVDALPVFKKLTLGDFLGSLLPCINRPFCCDRQWKADNAVILTNKRIITATRLQFAAAGEVGWEVTGYFLGTLNSGFIVSGARVKGKGNVFLGSVGSQYGGLTVNSHVVGSKACLAVGDAAIRKRAKHMWLSLSHGSINTIVPGNAIQAFAQGIPNSQGVAKVVKGLPLQEGEVPLSGVESLNQYALSDYEMCYPCACGHYMCLKNLVTFITCGCGPFQNKQFLILTDRRVFAVSQSFNPGFLGCLCKKKPEAISWMTLDDIKSAKVKAEFNLPKEAALGFCGRLFLPICPCLNKAYASMDVNLGWKYRMENHPFLVKRYQPHAKEGIMEAEDILHFRKVLGAITSARTAAEAYEIMQSEAEFAGGAAK